VGEVTVVSKVMTILELLSDGKWHGIEDLLMKTGLNERKFQEITMFLSNYDFVKFDEEKRRVKINRDFKKLLAQPAA
jgi:DNA-binding IclR family transcriptional regulator